MIKAVEIKEANLRRFPEAVALIVSKSEDGIVNLCPIGHFCMAASNPKTWGIGVYKDWQTNKNITQTKEFVLCLPSMDQMDDLLYCGSHHGKDGDKTKKLSLTFQKSKYINVPVVEDSVACFECKVVKSTIIGDHTFFFGEIIASYVSDKTWKDKIYNWDDKRLGTLTYGENFKEMNFSPQGNKK